MNNKIINRLKNLLRSAIAIIMTTHSYCYNGSPALVLSNEKMTVSSIKQVPAQNGWLNSSPLNLSTLSNQELILFHFWTLSDVGSMRQISMLNSLASYYKQHHLKIIGVHSPRFEIEKKPEVVLDAVKKYHISYPILLDGDAQWWDEFGLETWPTLLLQSRNTIIFENEEGIDPYALELEIRRKLAKIYPKIILPPFLYKKQPEEIKEVSTLFAGPDFMNTPFGNSQLPIPKKNIYFTVPSLSFANKIYLEGQWFVHNEFIISTGNGSILVPYTARSAMIFLKTDIEKPIMVEVYLDGKPIPPLWQGLDIQVLNGKTMMKVDQARLYYPLSDTIFYGKHVIAFKVPAGLAFYLISFET